MCCGCVVCSLVEVRVLCVPMTSVAKKRGRAHTYHPHKNVADLLCWRRVLRVLERTNDYSGHCQKLAPEWTRAAKAMKGVINFGAIDCDVESNKPLCGQFQIKGFPTIKVFEPSKPPTDYQGAREAKALQDFASNMVPSASKRITAKNVAEFIKGKMPKVILFTDKDKTPLLYKALSNEFKKNLAFGDVSKTTKEVVKQFDITSFPTIVVLPAGAEATAESATRFSS